MNHTLLRLAPAVALLLPLLAAAQPASDPPNTAKAPSKPAALRYDSAFTGYKPYRDLEPGDWRALNDALGATAPNMGHAGHSMAPAPAAAPTPAKPASAAAPHPGQHPKHHDAKGGAR